jgi:hypothetical protein
MMAGSSSRADWVGQPQAGTLPPDIDPLEELCILAENLDPGRHHRDLRQRRRPQDRRDANLYRVTAAVMYLRRPNRGSSSTVTSFTTNW